MRVIAGRFRRRLLVEADRTVTRATTDKNREMVFNILGQYFDGGAVLDLYAGTGAMGIEALSRGAESAVFVDQDRTACAAIRTNLDRLEVSGMVAEVVRADAVAYLEGGAKRAFDLLFLDPPYADRAIPAALAIIASRRLLAPSGTLVAETDAAFVPAAAVDGLELVRDVVAGSARFAFYRWRAVQ